MAWLAAVVAAFLATSPALAQNMSPETARRFVTGKLFAFRCVDGTGGSGRIYADGSVLGKLQQWNRLNDPFAPIGIKTTAAGVSWVRRWRSGLMRFSRIACSCREPKIIDTPQSLSQDTDLLARSALRAQRAPV